MTAAALALLGSLQGRAAEASGRAARSQPRAEARGEQRRSPVAPAGGEGSGARFAWLPSGPGRRRVGLRWALARGEGGAAALAGGGGRGGALALASDIFGLEGGNEIEGGGDLSWVS